VNKLNYEMKRPSFNYYYFYFFAVSAIDDGIKLLKFHSMYTLIHFNGNHIFLSLFSQHFDEVADNNVFVFQEKLSKHIRNHKFTPKICN
jgi:hypothetical protein